MYKSLSIHNFRHFIDVEITGFKRVNLVTGMNNVGKTAFLEALFTHCGAPNPDMVNRINRNRDIAARSPEYSSWDESSWDSLFPYFDSTRVARLTGQMEPDETRSIELRVLRDPSELKDVPAEVTSLLPDGVRSRISTSGVSILQLTYEEAGSSTKYYMADHPSRRVLHPVAPDPAFPTSMVSDFFRIPAGSLAALFGNLERRGEEGMVLETLRAIEPRLKRLATISLGVESILHGQLEGARLIPLSLMGGGTARLAELVCHLANCRHGVLLIDEIENGLHHSVLEKVWLSLGRLAGELDVQVFATTHSDECIQAAHEAFGQLQDYDFCLFRLDRLDGKIVPVPLGRDELETAIESNVEVRGYE